MNFKRIMRYIVPIEANGLPSGDVNEQSLLYQKVEGRWELVYDYYRNSGGQEYENKRIENPPTVIGIPPFDGVKTFNNQTVIIIEGVISYNGDDALNDNFRLRTEIKYQMMFRVQQIFDDARNRIQEQKNHLNDLLSKYEHLSIKG